MDLACQTAKQPESLRACIEAEPARTFELRIQSLVPSWGLPPWGLVPSLGLCPLLGGDAIDLKSNRIVAEGAAATARLSVCGERR